MSDLADRRGIETEIYEAAEDSHLLLEAARPEIEGADLVLEVGTGSGYVASEVREGTGATVIGSDINPHACRRARELGIQAVCGDLVAPFQEGVFDAVLFNPPYLPRVELAARNDWVEDALTGGETGREVIEPFVETVGRVLAPGGAVYLVVSTLTGPEAVESQARSAGFDVQTVREASFPFEKLLVLELKWT
ncbi:methyltransferase domain-containing protein [Halodesulfurarchaeum sp. HSR-GB]|uniref:HemK2/MTQ2 family protein methyltransferase n=1 Tax=Halodesulfurarchaeum sp. HSR-GB TaxID=3074077 RepID=UPI0028646393|nr:HemK2/MTQ2 family protein methyltransferase [Halodesulfurarchaeum sp. HSR-GB]MDR5657484.1 methyltransferase domain-containing protein [Halodesulfurarchaeum sp. HSR-GB]